MQFLNVLNVSKHFGGLKAVDEVNMSMEQGEILGIIGPNGAGKTTLFNLVSASYRPTAGEIWFQGHPVHNLKQFQVAHRGLARSFQIVRPFADLSALENVIAGCGCKSYEKLFSMFLPAYSPQTREKALNCLEMVELADMANIAARNLPLGMLRRLEIARAMAIDPQLILLDESFSGLSHEESESLGALVRKLRSGGLSFIVIEHNIQIVTSLCDRLVVLNYGRKIAEGTPEEVIHNPEVIKAYLGGSDNACSESG